MTEINLVTASTPLVLTIMRGIPGSGKSYHAREIAKERNALVVSADDYPGLYTHNPDGSISINLPLQGAAQGWAFRRAYEALSAGRHVVIDNTNLSQAEVAPYVLMGQALGATEINLVTVLCDPEVAQKRNTHGVPTRVYAHMLVTMERFTHADHWRHVPGFTATTLTRSEPTQV